MKQSWTLRMLRRVVAFVVAAVAMVLLGSAAHSFFVQQAWANAAGHAYGTAPAAIPLADRISWAAHDLVGMFLPYCTVTSIALFVAFLIAGGLARFTGFRVIVFGLAGALALFVLFTVMRSQLGTVGIFGARGPAGLAAQMAVGAVAGVLFARLTKPPEMKPTITTTAS
jgi:cellobiose-specific phosphotransferase system component IIC